MPVGKRVRANNVFGVVNNNPLSAGDTTLNSVELTLLPEISGNHAVLTLDPLRQNGTPEIVVVTAHTAGAQTATITRSAYGTVARSHPQGTEWVHGPMDEDVIAIVTSSTRPADPYEGQLIYETDTNALTARIAGSWTGLIPVGVVQAYAGTSPPPGWLLCNGAEVSRTTYASLFTVIGIAYGAGNGTSTFNLPDLRDRVPVGIGTTFNMRGASGGSATSTASHTHNLQNHTHGMKNHSHGLQNHTHGGTTGDHDRTHYHGLEQHDHIINHWHTGNIGSVKYLSGTQAHNHGGGAGWAAEAPSPNNGTAASVPINVDGTAQAAPNGNNRSSWVSNTQGWQGASTGHLHSFGTGGPSNNTSNGPNDNNSDGPSSNISNESSAALSNGNMQPYQTVNYMIKV